MNARALVDSGTSLLALVWRFDQPADAVISQFFREHRGAGSRDRQVLTDTIYAALRRRLWLEHAAAGGPGTLHRRLVLLAWEGEPQTLDSAILPDERAWLATASAVAHLPDPQLAPEWRHHLPAWLAERLRAEVPDAEWDAMAASLITAAPLDLRANALRGGRDKLAQRLAEAGHASVPTPYAPGGLRLDGKPALQRHPAFLDGSLEVQDEGSQLLALLCGAARGETVVDFCAGAGGKTLALGAMMRDKGRIYAMDTSAHRLQALKPRLARAGLTIVHPMALVHQRDERLSRLVGKADRVLVDAPCSGLGTLRRNPSLKWALSAADISAYALMQADILRAAARLVRPGGRLVYATCSLLEEENEAIAQSFEAPADRAGRAGWRRLEVAPLLTRAQVPQAEALCEGPNLRLWPHRHRCDGFFAAVWERG
jgi:16S rRNA (cytosine967-C5)-methyltransferase